MQDAIFCWFISDARVRPIYKPSKNDSFEDGVQSISEYLNRSGLFDKNDDHAILIINRFKI